MQPSPNASERRKHPRQRQLRKAKIIYGNGNCVFDCTIKDISQGGARLDLGTIIDLPKFFWIHFDDGKKREAEVAWRKSTKLGFASWMRRGSRPHAPAGHHERPAILEKITVLERQLAEIRQDLMLLLSD